MSSAPETSRVATQLLLQDEPFSPSEYKEHRMKLESALTTAERGEKLTAWVAAGSFAIAAVLMFVCGSRVFGSPDPWDKEATILSVTLGVMYALAMLAWPLALATGFARFRPRVRDIKEQIRDTHLLALHGEIAELRKQISATSGHHPPSNESAQ